MLIRVDPLSAVSMLRWYHPTCALTFLIVQVWFMFTEVSLQSVYGQARYKRSYYDDNLKRAIDVYTASDDELKAHLSQYGVHYNKTSLMNIFQQPDVMQEETVRFLLEKYKEIKQRAPISLPKPEFRHPIISIDGFFTHGRTKIAKMVASALHGRRILLPTKHVTRLRTYFERPELKKHYYSLSKYMGSYLAMSYCRSAPVILERYWHDQATYVMAKSFNGLIPTNSSVYEFPKDLVLPDLMFYLNGALNHHLHNETTAPLHTHTELSLKILEIFRRMRNPKLIEIGPPSLPTPMVRTILAIVKSVKQNYLPRPFKKPIWRN